MSMTPEAVESFVECFNEQHPPGTPVIVIKDHGEKVDTKTRSLAEVRNDTMAVVFLNGIAGYYDLTRVVVKNEPLAE